MPETSSDTQTLDATVRRIMQRASQEPSEIPEGEDVTWLLDQPVEAAPTREQTKMLAAAMGLVPLASLSFLDDLTETMPQDHLSAFFARESVKDALETFLSPQPSWAFRFVSSTETAVAFVTTDSSGTGYVVFLDSRRPKDAVVYVMVSRGGSLFRAIIYIEKTEDPESEYRYRGASQAAIRKARA